MATGTVTGDPGGPARPGAAREAELSTVPHGEI